MQWTKINKKRSKLVRIHTFVIKRYHVVASFLTTHLKIHSPHVPKCFDIVLAIKIVLLCRCNSHQYFTQPNFNTTFQTKMTGHFAVLQSTRKRTAFNIWKCVIEGKKETRQEGCLCRFFLGGQNYFLCVLKICLSKAKNCDKMTRKTGGWRQTAKVGKPTS